MGREGNGFFNPPCMVYRQEGGGMKREIGNKMKVNGEASVRVKPDMAIINIGVTTMGENLENVRRENAAAVQRVIDELIRLGVRENDIQTLIYNVEPVYEYVEGRQVFKGYRGMNTLKVIVRNTDMVGEIIDRTLSTGANTITNIRFDLSNPRGYYNRALELAVKDAILKAQTIAKTLGVQLRQTPAAVREISYGYGPIEMASSIKLAAATPIVTGEIEVTARVEADFIYI